MINFRTVVKLKRKKKKKKIDSKLKIFEEESLDYLENFHRV